MNASKTTARFLLAAVAAIAGLALDGGCAAYDSGASVVDAGGSGADVGMVTGDASFGDVGPAVPDYDAGTGGLENTDVACADFTDDDRNSLVDCADTVGCGSRPICCVGSTSPTCCVAPTSLAPLFDLDACADGTIAGCVTGMSAFGSPSPTIATTRSDGGACAAGSTIAPQGSDRSDGGFVATTTLDTRTGTVAIEATIGASAMRASSLDAIAVGLTDQATLVGSTDAHVRPVVAVLLSATDQTIRAVAGDVAFPARPLSTVMTASGCTTELSVRVVTSPGGTFDVSYRHDPTDVWLPLATGLPFQPTASAHAVAYGRSTNPGIDGVHAWIRSLSASGNACDVMSPVRSTTGAFTTLPSVDGIRSVSRVGPLAVYETDGSIFVAGVDGTGHLAALGRTGPEGDRILAPTGTGFMAASLADPELVAIDDNRRLFFTGIDATGHRSIGYVDFDTDVMQRVIGSEPRELITGPDVGATDVDGPAYFETVDGSAIVHRWIVFRAVVDATHSELRAAELIGGSAVLGADLEMRDATAGASPQFFTDAHPSSATSALYANRADLPSAFDHDEIASPEVIAYRGVVRVLFAARSGARWSIGMLRSPDFAHFTLAYPGPVLSGTGVGIDAVSVSDPDVSVDAAGALTLYYTAFDGTTTQPAFATQRVGTP
jgi:hypothetical protein